tara:strand:- start:56 stop:274 length:219 start_codon:yes stop_codon:yes gene_type:complete
MKKLFSTILVLGLLLSGNAYAGFFDFFKPAPTWVKELCSDRSKNAKTDTAAQLIYDSCVEEQKKFIESSKKK